ncbi:MAG: ATP synthase F1 subunit gamma [Lachnospiraceae bacterium]|nr:ATP synthase F1 subunit gamma [Lachnospiraceae bacterium]
MASASELRIRIGSITDTKKVTDAMFMISSVKMRKAKAGLEGTKPYFDALRGEIGELLLYFPETKNRYFRNEADEGIRKQALVLITADKGLAGNYNREAIRMAEEEIASGRGTVLYPVGEYGRRYFANGKAALAKDFNCPAAFPTIHEARKICQFLLEAYNEGEVDEINVIYTVFHNGRPNTCKKQCLLPLEKSAFYASEQEPSPFGKEYSPDPDTVLNGIVPSYLTGFLYSALVESYSSEQSARMEAMQTAGNNAEDMLKQLRIEYNNVRQAAITREITEISSGAKALRAKREKQKREALGS